MAITGKPLAATAGAMMFQRGGNAVDAACAMIAATSTMWDVLRWGGETQALVYDPRTKKVIAINGLGVAPTGATPEFYREQGHGVPARVRPARGGHARHAGRPDADARRVRHAVARRGARARDRAGRRLPDRRGDRRQHRALEGQAQGVAVLEAGDAAAPRRGARGAARRARSSASPTSRRRCASWSRPRPQALAAGKSRKDAIQAAYDRFYRGDIAREFVRGTQEQGGLITLADLAHWQPLVEEPLATTYRGIDVYKLDTWTQGPALLQSLNILENFDLKAMGYNSANYIHTVYQAMNLAFADRDFYYGDPYFPPEEPTPRPAVEGVREGARRDDPHGSQRRERPARRSVSVPGRHEPVRRPAASSSATRRRLDAPPRELTRAGARRLQGRLPAAARPRWSRPTHRAGWSR